MTKQDRDLIKMARDDMDENPVSQAVFKIQSILEDVYQRGINVGEAIGAAKMAFEVERTVAIESRVAKKSCKNTKSKGEQ